MIIEQRIGYWVSLAPFSPGGSRLPEPVHGKTTRHCMLFPSHFMDVVISNPSHLAGISDFKTYPSLSSITNVSFTVSAYFRNVNGLQEVKFVDMNSSIANKIDKSKWIIKSQVVRQIWYYNWKDFIIPPSNDIKVNFSLSFPMILSVLSLFFK